MSRGFGKQQTAILRKIQALHSEGHQITSEELRWLLYFEKFQSQQAHEDLPKSWCNAFRTALAKLEKGEHIKVHRRVLENFDECVRHYPGKTTDGQMRQLRKKMLPHLANWLEADSGAAYPKYGLAQNEVFRLDQMSKTEQQNICDAWQAIAPQLDAAYRTSNEPDDGLFLLICKGREYFLRRDVSTPSSITALVENLKPGMLPAPLAETLGAFMHQFMPKDEARALAFRSIIHSFTSIPSLGTACQLHGKTLKFLHQKDRAFIEGMEGTRLGKTIWNTPVIDRPSDYDPNLLRLFDHSVFRIFKFLEPG